MNLSDYFQFSDLRLSIIRDSEIDETVEIINPAYMYQESAKGAPRTNPAHLRQRAKETDFYVVKAEGKIVGCVYLEPRGTSLHFGLLTVEKAYRKTGLAQSLMKAIEEYANANRFKSLGLDFMSVAQWLRRYYEGYGFKETGEVTHWGTIDLISMTKSLS